MDYQNFVDIDAQVITGPGTSAPFAASLLTLLCIDINVSSVRGTSGAVSFFVERQGTDLQWYPFYSPTALTAPGFASTTAGAGQATNTAFAKQCRLRWSLAGSAYTTTVGTGANSATQQVASTANMAVGDTLHFGTANVDRTVISITDGTHVVVNSAVNSTTSETVTIKNTPSATFSASIWGK